MVITNSLHNPRDVMFFVAGHPHHVHSYFCGRKFPEDFPLFIYSL